MPLTVVRELVLENPCDPSLRLGRACACFVTVWLQRARSLPAAVAKEGQVQLACSSGHRATETFPAPWQRLPTTQGLRPPGMQPLDSCHTDNRSGPMCSHPLSHTRFAAASLLGQTQCLACTRTLGKTLSASSHLPMLPSTHSMPNGGGRARSEPWMSGSAEAWQG